MHLQNKHETVQCWVALFLTTGEFGAAIYLFFYEGHILALYLAFTYLARETSGGHHYHEILIEAWGKVIRSRKADVGNDDIHEQL